MDGCLENKAYDPPTPGNFFLSFWKFKIENWQEEPLLQMTCKTALHEGGFISD